MTLHPLLRYLPAVVTACVLAFTPADVWAQEGGDSEPKRIKTFSPDELETTFFRPENIDPRALHDLAYQMYGRALTLDQGTGNYSQVRNIQRLGDALVLYDTAAELSKLTAALSKLDGDAGAAGKHTTGYVEPVTVEWSPRYISLSTAQNALRSFLRNVGSRDQIGNYTETANVSALHERSVLILRDTPERVEQMTRVLDELDQPEPQLLLNCIVLQGTHAPPVDGAARPPEELTRHLSKLVPFDTFQVVTMGLVRSSALAREIQIQMDRNFLLRLVPEAFDTQAKSLTAVCRFEGQNQNTNQSFETRTTVGTGEYTVLGAAGAQPLFVVLRMTSLD